MARAARVPDRIGLGLQRGGGSTTSTNAYQTGENVDNPRIRCVRFLPVAPTKEISSIVQMGIDLSRSPTQSPYVFIVECNKCMCLHANFL